MMLFMFCDSAPLNQRYLLSNFMCNCLIPFQEGGVNAEGRVLANSQMVWEPIFRQSAGLKIKGAGMQTTIGD